MPTTEHRSKHRIRFTLSQSINSSAKFLPSCKEQQTHSVKDSAQEQTICNLFSKFQFQEICNFPHVQKENLYCLLNRSTKWTTHRLEKKNTMTQTTVLQLQLNRKTLFFFLLFAFFQLPECQIGKNSLKTIFIQYDQLELETHYQNC